MLKQCTQCEAYLPKTDFSKHKYGKEGLRSTCKKCSTRYSVNYQRKNKTKKHEANKRYKARYKKQCLERTNKWRKERIQKDPTYKLKLNLSCLIRNSIKFRGFSKNTKTFLILGCTPVEFRKYLENQFEDWMNWDNYGLFNGEYNYGWEIDHIIPISSANSNEEAIKLNHYTNLKPLCSLLNKQKGNKLDFNILT